MKYTILLLTIASFTMCSYAASIQWGGSDGGSIGSSGGSGTFTNYIAYLVQGDSTSRNTALTQCAAGTWAPTTINQALGDTGFLGSDDVALDTGLNAGTLYPFYVVIFDADKTHFMISSIQNGVPYDPLGATPATEVTWTAEQLKAGSTGWQKVNVVPEPTVLALLALGIAGLVLKRKVA